MNSQSLAGRLLEHFKYFGSKLSTPRERKMRLCETLSLGERRFLAVVVVEEQKFLIGGAGNSVALLYKLPTRRQHPAGFHHTRKRRE